MSDSRTRPYFVGIAGGSGSGKTTLLRRLQERFENADLTFISLDNYYISRDDLPRDLGGNINFDHPSAMDLTALGGDLNRLAQGETVVLDEYTYNNPQIVPQKIAYRPAPIVVVEGLFVFNHPSVSEQLDLKVFVETHEHLRLSRRIRRDAAERGYGLEDVLSYYERFVAPMYREHIDPFRHECDLIVPNNRRMDAGIEVLIHHLEAVLRRKQSS
ncbi:MAG: uridine kinase [Bacteroidota bacterium]